MDTQATVETTTPATDLEKVAPSGWALSRRDPLVESIVRGTLVRDVLDVLTPGGGE